MHRESDVFPVEVRAKPSTESRSLRKFRELFQKEGKLRIRFSPDNLKLDGDGLSIPLFMADHTDRLIGLALKQKSR